MPAGARSFSLRPFQKRPWERGWTVRAFKRIRAARRKIVFEHSMTSLFSKRLKQMDNTPKR